MASKVLDCVRRAAGSELHDDEVLLAAVRAFHVGDRGDLYASGLPMIDSLAFAVTNERLLVFTRSALTARPKHYVDSVALDALAVAKVTPARFAPRLHLAFRKGVVASFEALKSDDPLRFAGTLNEVVISRSLDCRPLVFEEELADRFG